MSRNWRMSAFTRKRKSTLTGTPWVVRLKLRDGGHGEVQFFINDKEIKRDIGPMLELDSVTYVLSGAIDLEPYGKYFRPGSPNKVSIVAFNSGNYLASPRISVTYVPEAEIAEEQTNAFTALMKPRIYGIVVGYIGLSRQQP